MIVIHSNFLSAMDGFRDNEVLLPTGYDVIVISPLGSVFRRFFHDGVFRVKYPPNLKKTGKETMWCLCVPI